MFQFKTLTPCFKSGSHRGAPVGWSMLYVTCPTQVLVSLTLASLLVHHGGWWGPLLDLVVFTEPCPVVLVVPGTCQPPAAPCQCASQSHFLPQGGPKLL